MEKHTPGPRTTAGKQTSARNAITHGCCSYETLILPNESQQDFDTLEATWLTSYAPHDAAEHHLVRQLAQADWFLQRANRTAAEVETRLFAAQPNPLDWTDEQHKTHARFLRYRAAHTNNVAKCRKAIDDYRRNRILSELREEKITNTKIRLQIHQEKNRPEPTWKEHLLAMRQKAEYLGLVPKDAPPFDTSLIDE